VNVTNQCPLHTVQPFAKKYCRPPRVRRESVVWLELFRNSKPHSIFGAEFDCYRDLTIFRRRFQRTPPHPHKTVRPRTVIEFQDGEFLEIVKILALETSGVAGSVAIAEKGEVRAEIAILPPMRTTQQLAPTIQAILDTAGWQFGEIELVAVAHGPGSFTGLRIGVTTAKLLAYANACRLAAVDTLAVIAHQVVPRRRQVWALIDALRDQLFVARFRWEDGEHEPSLRQLQPSSLVDVGPWIDELADDCLAGPGIERIQQRLPPGVEIAAQEQWNPRASTVARLAWQAHLRGEYRDPWTFVPNYLRATYAEESRRP